MISNNDNYNVGNEKSRHPQTLPDIGMVPESLVQIVWRSRWIVLASIILALAAAFIYLQKATPIFTSTSRVYVEQSGPKIMSELEEGFMTRSKNYLYTQAELLKSTPIINTALDGSGIRQMKTFTGLDNPVAYLKKHLNVEVGKKDDIVNISFDSPYPAEAAHLVNQVVDSYITYHTTQKRSTSAEVLKILQNEKSKRSQEVIEKLKSLMDFKKQNMELAFESEQGNVILQRLNRLSVVLTEAQLKTLEAKSYYDAIKQMTDDPVKLREFVENKRGKISYMDAGNDKKLLETELNRLELQLADLQQQHALTSDHPLVCEVERKIDWTKKKIAESDEEYVKLQLSVAQQQYLSIETEEQQIAEYFEQQRQQALDLNDQLAQYAILQSDWEQTKKLCDILDDRIKELNVTEDAGALNISILEVARPANKPSKPQKARIMGIALVLSLMLGGGLALLRDWMDQRLRSAEEASAILGAPMLGVVPSMSRRQSIITRGQMVHLDSKSLAAEAYRTIRTAIFFSVPNGEAKTLLITSPSPGDGKTTLASNLAIAMAQAGQRVLLLDADFRKPVQHNIFEIKKEPGISDCIAGLQSLNKIIKSSNITGLDILPCGSDVPNPSEMLNSHVFSEIIAELSSRYDRIVVDSPPVIPVTDACILGAICDVTLLVLRAEKSTRKTAQQARDGLLNVGSRLLGIVVNDVSRSKGRYGYYNYGHYGYGYGHKDKDKKPQKERDVAAAVNMRDDIQTLR
jgi:succinoglycan biosynthesis transport protein ExoP